MSGEPTRKLILEVDPATGEALDRMAATLGTTAEEVAARMLAAAAAAGVSAAVKAVNTRTWRKPRRRGTEQ